MIIVIISMITNTMGMMTVIMIIKMNMDIAMGINIKV